MMRWIVFLGFLFLAMPASAQWKDAQNRTCSGLSPTPSGATWRCTHAITTTAATSTLDVSRCGTVTFLSQEADDPAADYTVMPQGCFTDVTGQVTCADLLTSALNGGTLYGYTHDGPLGIVRGNATVVGNCSASGDCYLEVICGP